MPNWLERETRRANRNLFLVNGAILVALLCALAVDWQYYANFVLSCKPISAEELASITSPSQRFRNFVTVHGTKSLSTGYQDIVQHIEKSSGRVVSTETKDEYVLLVVGGKGLLVKAPNGTSNLEFSGELVPTDDDVQRQIITPLAASSPDVASKILPFTLDATDYRTQGYWALGLGVPLFLLACWNFSKAFKRAAEPQLAPIWRQVSLYGNAEQLSAQIGSELQASSLRYGGLRLTPSWLVRKRLFSTWISPVQDVVWVYKKVTRHSVNFIPTGKSYAAVIAGGHRQRVEEKMSQKKVEALLAEMAARVPWAIYGFNAELDNAWKKDPGGFAAAVDARRQQLAAKPAATGS
jgi:hypothetical protein